MINVKDKFGKLEDESYISNIQSNRSPRKRTKKIIKEIIQNKFL